MDGVLTSEQVYRNRAAFTVYETTVSRRYFGKTEIDVDWVAENVAQIRRKIFCDDKIIMLLKNMG